jgi:small GTP-binding protein
MLSVGIVGLPNAGKSTLFNALVKGHAAVGNYAFTTIDANVGVVAVPDHRLDKLAAIAKPEKVTPTTIEFVDIAGLVKGAHKGEGLGNQFLAKIREVDAICFVVRAFEDANVSHVHGKVDPKEDLEVLQLELGLSDEQMKEKNLGNPDLPRLMLLAKPQIVVANVGEQALASFDPAKFGLPGHTIPVSAKVEAELATLPDAERQEYLDQLGVSEPGLARVIREAYRVLGLVTFFTVGLKEVRAWTVRKGETAPVAAGKVHSDFQKHLIRAEVISFDDYVRLGGEQQAKQTGKMRVEGKEYVVKDGDIIYFRVGT